MKKLVILAALCVVAVTPGAFAQDAGPGPHDSDNQASATPEDWSVHAQSTFIEQSNLRFHSPYRGRNSLDPAPRGRESWTGTLYLGARLPWDSGGALYFDPEFNQGFGLSKTEGVAGYINGEAQKGGFDTPKPNVARLFVRQNFGLGGDPQNIAAAANQLADVEDANRVTVTVGKYSPTDIFDTNDYANDPRLDFMNGSIWAAGAWDYPADSKGYSDGATVEWVHPEWTLRGGWFLEPKIANQRDLEPRFWHSFGSVAELENHFSIGARPGVLRTLVFANRAPMGSNSQAIANGANMVVTRRSRWKPGLVLNLQQELADELGFFGRFSVSNGHTESWAFEDIDQSESLGLSLKGGRWSRPDDTLALGVVQNELTQQHRGFFYVGGTGILVGDGTLSYRPERILETYYRLQIFKPLSISLDYQYVVDPAYNSARGPVSVFAGRIHLEY
ncbi:MAG TPA: carbohydrate porin [Stellaceae bacterium]|jgi:high affinity Mn2+ porin|nr:carbohydrate porin [Stellaceae bacterium]